MYGYKIKTVVFLVTSFLPWLSYSAHDDYHAKRGCMACHQSDVKQDHQAPKKKLHNSQK